MQNVSYRTGGEHGFSISQSLIKAWRNFSPKKWHRKFIENITEDEEVNPAFLLGDLLDTLLCTPELLNDRFFVANIEKLPSEVECKIIECIYNRLIDLNREAELLSDVLPESPKIFKLDLQYEESKEIILQCCNKESWQSSWKDETRINKIIERGIRYFEMLSEANGRKIISSTLNMQAVELVEILKANKWTKDYFVESEGNELIFQLEIFANYIYIEDIDNDIKKNWHNIPIKGALDILRINHKSKTVQICDFKKAFSAHQFLENARKYDYASQLSFYDYLLKIWIKASRPDLLSYTMENPINIVIDISDKEPYRYLYTWEDINIARYGNAETFQELFHGKHPFRIKKGWQELLNEICYHYIKNEWSVPRKMLEEGVIIFNLSND